MNLLGKSMASPTSKSFFQELPLRPMCDHSPQLVENVNEVRLHGGGADVQLLANLSVARASRHQLQHLYLPRTQIVFGWGPHP